MKIILQFTHTQADVTACMRGLGSHIKASPLLLLVLLGFEAAVGISALAYNDMGRQAAQYIGYAGPLLLIVVFAIYNLVAPARATKKQLNTNEDQVTETWVLDQEHLTISREHLETKFRWDVFSELIEMEDYLVLQYSPDREAILFHCLPKRAFESPSQESTFREMCEQKLGESKTGVHSKRRPVLSMRALWQLTAIGGIAWLALIVWQIVTQ